MSNFVGSIGDVTKTGSIYVDSLLWGSRWKIENDNRKITYSFVDNNYWDYNFDNTEINAFTNAIKSWANVANLQLEYSGFNDSQAELTFHSVDSSVFGSSNILGLANPPGEYSNLLVEGDVLINWEFYQDDPGAKLLVGSYYYQTFVHEIGHALGLAHPHDNGGSSSIFPGVDNALDSGDLSLNQFLTTVMSYVDIQSPYSPGYDANWGFSAGPMAFDIAAVQHIYGINRTSNTGNNVYLLPSFNGVGTYWSCIWDAGGTDTISGQGASNSVVIDLNNATLANNDPNAGGFISQVVGVRGGFTIANSQGGVCVIENAIGSNFNDTLTGNEYNNYLFGQGGNDVINGKAGIDTLSGGSGNDILVGGADNDILTGGAGGDRFTFQSRSEGIDRITDFSVLDDTIVVSAAGFGGGLVAGAAIATNNFAIGTAATTSSQRFIYNTGNGSLFFDQDGIGAIAKIQIATLNTGLSLNNADIFVAA